MNYRPGRKCSYRHAHACSNTVRLCVGLWVIAIIAFAPGTGAAADKYYYVGGVKPIGIPGENETWKWSASTVSNAYDEILEMDDSGNVWEIRVAAGYNECPASRVLMDGTNSNGQASASKVAGIYGSRVWDASTSSHDAVGTNYNNKSTLDGNYEVAGGLIRITSASGMTTGPVIDGLKLTRGDMKKGYATTAGIYCTVSRTTLSNLEICYCRDDYGRYGLAMRVLANDCLITDCWFHDNTGGSKAYDTTVDCGAIDRILVRNCLFSGNAAIHTAGLWNQSGPGAIVNCAFIGNTVRESSILALGRTGVTVVNVLIADNHSEAGYNASNYLASVGGHGSVANNSYFANVTIADNYDTTPPTPESPGVCLYGESSGSTPGPRESYVMNTVFKNNHGIVDDGRNTGAGWIVYTLADDELPDIGTMENNVQGSATFRSGTYELASGSLGIDAGGYVKTGSRSGKSFKYLDVNRDNDYDICLDVIVWAESGFSFYPPLSGANFDIVATNALGSWNANGVYTEGNPRILSLIHI